MCTACPEGLAVCDYAERRWGKQGATQAVVEPMAWFGAFADPTPVVEIGAGTGRYLERVLQKCHPAKYEGYETVREGAEWPPSEYGVVSHEADGITLWQTPDASASLVHAHGAVVNTPFFVSHG